MTYVRSTWLQGSAWLVAVLPGLLAGCAAPTFSDLQSAKLAGRGRLEITPSYSSVSFVDQGESEKVQDHYGMQLATGVADWVDLRFRYERIEFPEDGEGFNVVGFGPKVGIATDRVALGVPIGFAFGDDIEVADTFQIHPTLLLTLPVEQVFELNASAKLLIPLSGEGQDVLEAINFGVGLSNDLRVWAFRPEVGFLFGLGDEGYHRHLSVGVTAYLGR
ncbi:MAG TPA: hypothetical protein VGK93_02880 [Candidatus Eisenbacteria bacterium]